MTQEQAKKFFKWLANDIITDIECLFPEKVTIIHDKKNGRYYSEIINRNSKYCPKQGIVFEDHENGISIFHQSNDLKEGEFIKSFISNSNNQNNNKTNKKKLIDNRSITIKEVEND